MPDDRTAQGQPWDGLEDAYLAATDPRGGSGFRGDEARWERARRVIADAIDRDGTFLDVGCANGLLMESMRIWATERGFAIEPSGLDVSRKLAELAQRRLPAWAGRIHVGDARAWAPAPSRRFDFVRTSLECADRAGRPALVEHLLQRVVAPGGRLIVCAYGKASAGIETVEPVGAPLREWGHVVGGEAFARDSNGVVFTRVAWIDGPGRRGSEG
jgi:SAM-dependent methyltransferase